MMVIAFLMSTSATPDASEKMSNELARHARNEVKEMESKSASFYTGTYDLNEDGNPEGFVMVEGKEFCGSGGCTLEIMRRNGENLDEIGDALTYPDAKVLPSKTRGYHDIAVSVNEGAGSMSTTTLCWHGGAYQPCADVRGKMKAAGRRIFSRRVVERCRKMVSAPHETLDGRKFDNATIGRIKAGMTVDGVLGILGEASGTEIFTDGSITLSWDCITPDRDDPAQCRRLSLEFDRNRVLNLTPFDWAAGPDRPAPPVWCRASTGRSTAATFK